MKSACASQPLNASVRTRSITVPSALQFYTIEIGSYVTVNLMKRQQTTVFNAHLIKILRINSAFAPPSSSLSSLFEWQKFRMRWIYAYSASYVCPFSQELLFKCSFTTDPNTMAMVDEWKRTHCISKLILVISQISIITIYLCRIAQTRDHKTKWQIEVCLATNILICIFIIIHRYSMYYKPRITYYSYIYASHCILKAKPQWLIQNRSERSNIFYQYYYIIHTMLVDSVIKRCGMCVWGMMHHQLHAAAFTNKCIRGACVCVLCMVIFGIGFN